LKKHTAFIEVFLADKVEKIALTLEKPLSRMV
jgi:hypothetical protein